MLKDQIAELQRRRLMRAPVNPTPMAKLTLRYIKGEFVISGADLQPVSFTSRRRARDWRLKYYPDSPLMEIGQGARNGRVDRRNGERRAKSAG
jgi:hypothetical protein